MMRLYTAISEIGKARPKTPSPLAHNTASVCRNYGMLL